MNQQDREYFSILRDRRTFVADALQDPAAEGVWEVVVDKYSDQAHFVYELLQNADDAGATVARFMLEPDRLVFAHNGTRHFTITNPETERQDRNSGDIGDVNAITAIRMSGKEIQENKIGKFGIGFKSVFQYTTTPFIYDPSIRFRIDRYIVPTLLEDDYLGRRPEETLFVFPFNHHDKTQDETYEDIKRKLKELKYPVLFLSHLRYVSYEFGNTIGLYEKNVSKDYSHAYKNDMIVEKIRLQQNHGEDIITQNIWLFSRKLHNRNYSVGYFLDDNDQLKPVTQPAFCYFPTKETTGLNFIIHAPFLLTDSREGIRSGVSHNNELVSLLAKLAADSLLILRDIGVDEGMQLVNDDILNIIPIREQDFCEVDDTSKISFKPFYTEIKRVFGTESIIPTRDGYTSKENAYWADVPYSAELFNDNQLAEIVSNPSAQWVFCSLGHDNVRDTRRDLQKYIIAIVRKNISEEVLIRGTYPIWAQKREIVGISEAFIEHQSVEWLCSLYKWLSDTANRTELAKKAPIFLDQDSKAVAAFDEKNRLQLFLPSDDIPNCRSIREDFVNTKEAATLIARLGITEPSFRDEIYTKIIPLYQASQTVDAQAHFLLFFKYYSRAPQKEGEALTRDIYNLPFLQYITQGEDRGWAKATELYLPSEKLNAYFIAKPSVKFVAYDEYLKLVGVENENQLKSFLHDLGVQESVCVKQRSIGSLSRPDLPKPEPATYRKYKEPYIDGCVELVDYIADKQSTDLSLLLWNQLVDIMSASKEGNLTDILSGKCEYTYYGKTRNVRFDSLDAQKLKSAQWLMDSYGRFVQPGHLTRNTISTQYPLESAYASKILEFLGIHEDDDSNLTESQRERVEYADWLIAQGIGKEKLAEILRKYHQEAQQTKRQSQESEYTRTDDYSGAEKRVPSGKPMHKTTSRVVGDILNRTNAFPTAHTDEVDDSLDDFDADEYTPTPVDYGRKVELEKEKAAKAIDRIAYQEELQQRAMEAKKYSFGWFKALLELEALNSNAGNQNSREVSISFARVERDPGTQRTLVLKQPNRYIPQFMEDLADIPLILKIGDEKRTLAIEVANVKSYTLRVKLKSHVDISDLDFSKVTEAKIDAKSPAFLLEALRKEFCALDYEDDFDMQENLCENIEFVFGPPGTGKTTHLARNVLMPLMQGEEKPKVLVLTPTNKSADVLVRRIMDVMGEDTSYNDWLVRFGGTGDEVIEQSQVYREKTFDIRKLAQNVTVTTIARFPYDFFMPVGDRMFLHGIKWDYIVIDEASMIPLVNIILPLYKKTPKKFIIAGDPFQIEPIASVELWKDENIYTLVHLDSFVEPHTIPHDYHVELLTTQYRSVPSVGTVFSKFAYGGILNHHRTEESRKALNVDLGFPIKPLNIIKFPVSKYESIYRAKYLQHRSPYQVYSALFTFEFTVYFAKALAAANPKGLFRIGIIAPYRAQSDLIEKLVGSEKIPEQVDIQVGTIHGFQGDECDIIFTVFNSPPSISDNPNMFLNKRNIVNVSISRAKDYLFVLMPDDRTDNINRLHRIKRVEQLIEESGSYEKSFSPEWEHIIFGSETYLEDNAFSTGHQSVNVYGLPEKRYEVRSEDSAVDVQIHRQTGRTVESVKTAINEQDTQPNIAASVERVYSTQYGEGEIVSRIVSGGKTWITVQYANTRKGYDENLALTMKAIIKR